MNGLIHQNEIRDVAWHSIEGHITSRVTLYRTAHLNYFGLDINLSGIADVVQSFNSFMEFKLCQKVCSVDLMSTVDRPEIDRRCSCWFKSFEPKLYLYQPLIMHLINYYSISLTIESNRSRLYKRLFLIHPKV